MNRLTNGEVLCTLKTLPTLGKAKDFLRVQLFEYQPPEHTFSRKFLVSTPGIKIRLRTRPRTYRYLYGARDVRRRLNSVASDWILPENGRKSQCALLAISECLISFLRGLTSYTVCKRAKLRENGTSVDSAPIDAHDPSNSKTYRVNEVA